MQTKTRFIPAGAAKLSDKQSDAVAYFYRNAYGNPCMRVFYGKQSKPVAAYRYRTDADREQALRRYFDARRQRQQAKAQTAAEDKAWVSPYKVGDIFKAVWGYDQTNVNYFEAIATTAKTVTVRELQQETSGDGWNGKCVPLPGQFRTDGKAKKCLAQKWGLKISSCQRAYFVEPTICAGVKVYQPDGWSATC